MTAPGGTPPSAAPAAGSAPSLVLLVEAALRENGGVRVTLDYAARWTRRGDGVVLAVVQDVTDGPVARPGPDLEVRYLSPRGARARYVLPAALVRLIRLARRSQVVVSGSEEGHGLLLGWLAARVARRPFAVLAQCDVAGSIEAWVPRRLQPATRWIHAHTDATVCVAESVRDGVVALGLPPERAHVVDNGVDVARVRQRATGPPVLPPGPPTVVGCGRLAAAKGFDLLVRAHARVRGRGLDHRLLILGEGPERARLEDLARELGVSGSVTMPGFVDDPPASIARADLFVLSSRFEGAPLVLLEALALGAPIVATRCASAVAQLLDDGAVGDLVDVDDVDGLAAAVEAHLRDGRRLRDRARGGPGRAAGRDAEHAADRFRSILRGLAPGT